MHISSNVSCLIKGAFLLDFTKMENLSYQHFKLIVSIVRFVLVKFSIINFFLIYTNIVSCYQKTEAIENYWLMQALLEVWNILSFCNSNYYKCDTAFISIYSLSLERHTVVCKKIAAVHDKAHFWLFHVEISLRFRNALNCR